MATGDAKVDRDIDDYLFGRSGDAIVSSHEIAAALVLSDDQVRASLRRLRRRGKVRQTPARMPMDGDGWQSTWKGRV